MKKLEVDNTRKEYPKTGIFFRAFDEKGKCSSEDLSHLKKASVKELLNEKPKEWAMDIVGILLGHGHLSLEEEE